MQGFLSSYLEKSVETFMHQQDLMQSQIAKLMNNTPLNTMAELTRQNLEAWTKMQGNMFSAFKPPRDEKEPPPPPDPDERRS
jgi:polyhydroxyalkanoate synthesis regulator protein